MNSKKIGLLLLTCIMLSSLMAQEKDTTLYPVVVQFQSFCCGVPDDGPLRDFICTFKKKNKIKKITTTRIGPMGKEGEYWLAFSLTELNNRQAALFKTQIKDVAGKLTDKGAAVVEENIHIITSELPRNASVEKIVF